MLTDTAYPLVEISDFTKEYSAGGRAACSNISFSFSSGSITGLLGANGAGKTTILKALCGIHYPTTGTITIHLENEKYENNFLMLRKISGFVPEFPELLEQLTVYENLLLETKLYQDENEDVNKIILEAAKKCSIEDVLDKKCRSLSKGYRQRLSFAKAMVHKSRIYVLDEFSGGLDPSQIIETRKMIQTLSKKNAVILSTHHLDEAEALCSQLIILKEGKILASGTKEQILLQTHADSLEKAYIKLTSDKNKETE